jgi:MFS family permease
MTETTGADERSFLFRHPSFGWFWCARIASSLAFQMGSVAVGWQIYGLTHSTFQLGMIGLVQFAPIVLFTLVSGHVADRYDRRAIFAVAIAAQGVAAIVLGLGAWGHWIGVAGIYAMIAVVGAARAFQGPATQALTPTLVPLPQLPRAIAWSTSAFMLASIAGPAMGGLLYVFGPAVPYLAAGGLALLGAGFLPLVRLGGRAGPGRPDAAGSIYSGIHYIRSHPVILGSISLDLFAVLLGGATALLPAFASDILKVGSLGLGVLRAAPAVGSVCMTVVLARRPPRRDVGPKMFGAVLVFGLATIVFGLSRSYLLSLAALAVLGAADMVSVVIRSTLVQVSTPDAMRGRVGAVNSLFIGTSNQLGEFESGVTASLFGTVASTVLGGAGTLAVALLWMRMFPELRKFDRFAAKAEPGENPEKGP